jgi:hypothetical protein
MESSERAFVIAVARSTSMAVRHAAAVTATIRACTDAAAAASS